MQVLKKDKDGTAVADRPIFILETEETILGILVKYFLLPEAGCLQLYYQVEEEPTLYKAEESIPKTPFLDKKQEAALIQSFPEDFEFKESMGFNYKMIGNAVPPLMAEKIALAIAEIIA